MFEEFKKTKASKLWFSMAVVFVVILNVSFVEAKSLKKGEEFKEKSGHGAIRVVSSDEVEIERGSTIFLGKYTIDGERVRIVVNAGATMVQYYKITPDGLVEEKDGTIYYSKAYIAAEKEKMISAEVQKRKQEDAFKDRVVKPVLPKTIASYIDKHGLRMADSIDKGCRFDFKKHGNPFFVTGDFDGDGILDYAILVSKAAESVRNRVNQGIFVFLANGQIIEIPMVYSDHIYMSKKGVTFLGVVLKYDSIGSVNCERATSMYVYNETKKEFYVLGGMGD